MTAKPYSIRVLKNAPAASPFIVRIKTCKSSAGTYAFTATPSSLYSSSSSWPYLRMVWIRPVWE